MELRVGAGGLAGASSAFGLTAAPIASKVPRIKRVRRPAVVLLLLASFPLDAHADDDAARRAAAQALFDQASALMDKHDYASACPKLEEVARLQPGKVGTLVALAECFAGAGRVASAWTTYRQAADRAAALSDPRAADAQRSADALASRLPHLAVHVDARTKGLPGLDVLRDGVRLGSGAWETPIPIDPGEHVIEARAPDQAPLRATVTLAEGESKDVAIALQPEQAAHAKRARPAAGFVVGGVGLLGLGVGGVLGIVTLAKVGSSNAGSACMGGTHDQGDVSACNAQRDAARALQTGGILAAAVGGVALGTGAVLLGTAPRTSEKQAGPVAWALALQPTGASLAGRF